MNPRQRKFVEIYFSGIAKGLSAGRAYEEAGYTARGAAADSSAHKLLKNAEIAAYLKELQKAAKEATVMEAIDIMVFMSRAVTVPLSEIDETDPLCVEMVVDTIGEQTTRKKIKKADPLRAADIFNKMTAAYTPQKVEVSADDELSSILAGIAKAGANQDDKM